MEDFNLNTGYDLISTLPIETPYYRERFPDGPIDINKIVYNYNPYNLFCISTRLQPYLNDIEMGLSLTFKSIRSPDDLDKMKVYIDVLKHGDTYSISTLQHEMLTTQVKDILATYPDHCALFNFNTSFYYDGLWFNSAWLINIFQLLALDNKYDPIFYKNMLLINLSPKSIYNNFNGEHEWLKILYFNLLKRLWLNGAIVLHQKKDMEFINNWNLIPLNLDYISSSPYDGFIRFTTINDGYNIYQPIWIDPDITLSPTEFLLNRMLGLDIEVDVKKYPLLEFSPYVYRVHHKVYIHVDSYSDLKYFLNTGSKIEKNETDFLQLVNEIPQRIYQPKVEKEVIIIEEPIEIKPIEQKPIKISPKRPIKQKPPSPKRKSRVVEK